MPTHTPTFAALRPDRAQPVVDLGAAPLPTGATLRRRRSIPGQLVRFIAYNVRILRMVAAGRH